MKKEPKSESPLIGEKIKCHCPCHANPDIKHFMPCCENGYIEKPSWGTDYEVNKWLQSVDKDVYSLVTDLRDIFKNDPGTKGKMLASKAVKSYLSKSKPALIGERSAEEIAEEIMAAGQFGGSLEACTQLIHEYASRFKPKDGYYSRQLDRIHELTHKVNELESKLKAKEDSLPEATLISFLQNRIKDAFQAIESGMGSQVHPFDEVSTEGLKGMKLAYGDVLTEVQKVESKEDNKAFGEQDMREAFKTGERRYYTLAHYKDTEIEAAFDEWLKSYTRKSE